MHSQLRSTADASPRGNSSQAPSTTEKRPSSPSVNDYQSCPNCGTKVETVNTSEAVCPDCQIVVTSEPISTAPRPRYNDDEDSKARSGSRVTWLYADRGLGTGIENGAKTDAKGTSLSKSQRRLTRDKGWTKHLSSRDFRLDYALGEIRRMGGKLGIPSSELEQAARLYRQAEVNDHLHGRSVDGFAAATLLAAVRQSSLRLPVSQREVETVTRATTDQVRTARSVLEVHLDVEIPPMDPQDFLPYACSSLSAPKSVERCAVELLSAYTDDDEDFQSVSPRTLTAAALHAAFDVTDSEGRPTLAELSDVLGVAASTISQRKGDLLEYRGIWE